VGIQAGVEGEIDQLLDIYAHSAAEATERSKAYVSISVVHRTNQKKSRYPGHNALRIRNSSGVNPQLHLLIIIGDLSSKMMIIEII
jgi:hypothetical protein